MFGWLAAIFGGAIAGLIAKSFVKGEHPGGFWANALIGIVGGIIGRFVALALGIPGQGGPIWNLVIAVFGAVVLLVIYNWFTGAQNKTITE